MAEKRPATSANLSVYCSSAEDMEKICDICLTDGDHINAVGYCGTCKEYFCGPCFKSHSRSKASKNHELSDNIDVGQMTAPTPTTTTVDAGSAESDDDYTFVRSIDVPTGNDKADPYILDMALVSESKLALLDNYNKSLILLDTQTDTVIAEMAFENEPDGITAISSDELAAAFGPEHKIRIISTNPGLRVTRSFRVSGKCWGITFSNGKLYVSFYDPLQFQILGTSGALKRIIKPVEEIKKLCPNPSNIAVHPDEGSIFVSDWKNNVVLRIDMDGTLMAINRFIECPGGIICFPSAEVYVVSKDAHVLYKMPANLSEAFVILGELDLLKQPFAVCYSHGKKTLFLSAFRDGGSIQVYTQK